MISSFQALPVCVIIMALTISSCVQAANIVHVTVERSRLSSLVRSNEQLSLNSRSTVQVKLYNEYSQGFYAVNVTIGTPGQAVTLILDTGSSDTWVLSSDKSHCPYIAACPGGWCQYETFFSRIPTKPSQSIRANRSHTQRKASVVSISLMLMGRWEWKVY